MPVEPLYLRLLGSVMACPAEPEEEVHQPDVGEDSGSGQTAT